MIPYGRQTIDEDDIKAVNNVLRSEWLTTGPKVVEFEQAVADYVSVKNAVAVSSGTAALHTAMYAIGIGPGDEVIVPPMTFAATANCVVFQGGTPVFVDVDTDTLLLDPSRVEEKITEKTRAIIGVDYTGQPCDWDKLREIADKHGLHLVADGCHALGAEYKGRKVGSLADITIFSFHPVKHITTGEGGMVVTDNKDYADKMRIFRSHGITADARQREKTGDWSYEMVDLGYNYRISDIQCSLGLSQLKKISGWIKRRQEIAGFYNQFFAENKIATPLVVRQDVKHAYHLYVVRVKNRDKVFSALREKGIGVNVHYVPVYLHPYYKQKFGTHEGMCPNAEEAYKQILSLPMYPKLKESLQNEVVETLEIEMVSNGCMG